MLEFVIFCFDAELKSGFGLAQHESPVRLTAQHDPCNNRRVVLGPEHQPRVPARPGPFPTRAVLGLGSDGPLARYTPLFGFCEGTVSRNDSTPKNGRCKMTDLPRHIGMEFFTTIELIPKVFSFVGFVLYSSLK
jgi:hypothetical protein